MYSAAVGVARKLAMHFSLEEAYSAAGRAGLEISVAADLWKSARL